ncbi:hypothetical protein CAPN006_04400 [Capnocytophaga canimorsus]|nr:hypothetical protein CAPN006_04400 [Capnocytophaga canimorsus]GIM58182.1 hypothetical protein CAPN007_03890 [Capnocytophaga canimorsus]GJQ04490.1 hypothetical protein CAPN009_09050 [Capnocytophaga canimorsus]CEN50136.1 hypothetical protein CCAN2_2030012 [Capnocytophaga canimorsus]
MLKNNNKDPTKSMFSEVKFIDLMFDFVPIVRKYKKKANQTNLVSA